MKQIFGPNRRRSVRLGLERAAPLRRGGPIVAGGIEREPEVKPDERRPRMLGGQLTKPEERRRRPAGDRSSDRRLERVRIVLEERGELPARDFALAAVVSPLGAAKRPRLGVVPQDDAQLEARRTAGCLRSRAAFVIAAPEHRRAHGDARSNERSGAHDDAHARAGRHEARVAAEGSAAAVTGKSVAIFGKATFLLMPTYRELLQQVKGEIDEIDASRARELIDETERERAPAIVDVREREEWDEGHIPGAVHVPRGHLESRIERAAPDKSRPVLLYCAAGNRSAFAAKTLEELGYEHVVSLAGGFTDWKRNGYPYEVPEALDDAKRRRYSRHLLIPEVGEEGQLRLLQSRVLLIGAGGLGSPASLYLAAAGVGTLGIVDDDAVDETNLQRQIVHSTERLGDSKAESAKRTIEALNPDVTVKAFKERLTSENVDRILGEGWDVIVDGADNFPTRYLLNDASVWHRIPVVHGSIYRFEGQVTVFKPFEGPCYRCLFPQPPPPELAPSCAEGGVLGVLPGVIGSLQANEALKLALGIGDPLVGRLQMFDALAGEFTEIRLRRDPECPVCGENPTITDYIDYVEFCQGGRTHVA